MISLGKSEKFFLKNFCKIKSEKYLTKLTRPLIHNELGCQNREKINEKLTRALVFNELGIREGEGRELLPCCCSWCISCINCVIRLMSFVTLCYVAGR